MPTTLNRSNRDAAFARMPCLAKLSAFAVAGLLMLAVLPASTAAAQDVPRIAPTISAAGIDLSGLTVDAPLAAFDDDAPLWQS